MKKLLLISGVCAMAALASQTAQAEVKVRAGAASSTYSLGGDYITAESKYNPVNLGLTFASDSGMYVDLAYSGGTGKHDGWKSLGAPAEEFKRSDVALIVGASRLNPDNGIAGTFYVGLKAGNTTLGAQNAGLSWTEETFDTAGLVFGGGASFPIASGRAGSLGVNVGLGLMGATWKDNSAAGYNEKAKTALGVSFGVNYTYPITSNFGVTVDYKGNAYTYNFGDAATPFKVNEKISAFGATLYAKF
ncbi:MAG: hypothetical protein Q7T21_03435 [Gallionella sp.]|nr:hypothetical protein [Gallionella sp.]